MTCSVTDCLRPAKARGWCAKHHKRWLATGSPLLMKKSGTAPRPVADRFWEKVNKDGPIPSFSPELGQCWLWTAAKASKYGHGTFTLNRKNLKAYRWAYEALAGPIPEGLTLDHLCRVPACVNPAHLEPVTLGENVRREMAALSRATCPQGHSLDGDNLYLTPTGTRACRVCRKAADLRRKAKTRRDMTRCYRGHPWTEENTYVIPRTGHRRCRACEQLRKAAA